MNFKILAILLAAFISSAHAQDLGFRFSTASGSVSDIVRVSTRATRARNQAEPGSTIYSSDWRRQWLDGDDYLATHHVCRSSQGVFGLNPQERSDCGNLSNLSLVSADLSPSGNGGSARLLRGVDAHDANLSGANLSHAVMTSANLMRARVENANLFATYLVGSLLEGASFAGSTARYSAWSGTAGAGVHLCYYYGPCWFQAQTEHRVSYRNADLSNSFVDLDLLGPDLRGARFDNAFAAFADPTGLPGNAYDPNRWTSQLNVLGGDASGASFRGARFASLSFDETVINRLDLQDANLGAVYLGLNRYDQQELNALRLRARSLTLDDSHPEQRRFTLGSLEFARIGWTTIGGVNLNRMRMAGADFGMTSLYRALINYSDMRGVKLENSYSFDTHFHENDLTDASFNRSYLERTNFTGGKLVRANLSHADIGLSTFAFVDLTGANFSCANLHEVNFLNETLTHTNLSCAKISGGMIFPPELQTLQSQFARGMVLVDDGNYVGAPGQVEACRQICGPQW